MSSEEVCATATNRDEMLLMTRWSVPVLAVVAGIALSLPACNETRDSGASERLDAGAYDASDGSSLSGDAASDGHDHDSGTSADAEGRPDATDGQCTPVYTLEDREGGPMPAEWDLMLVGREEWGATMRVFVINRGTCGFELADVALDVHAAAAEWFDLELMYDNFDDLAVPVRVAPDERILLSVGFGGHMPYDTEYVATLVISIAELEQPIEILFRGMRVR